MLRVLLFVVPIALAVYALVDLVQTEDDQVQGLPKLAWVALIVLIWVVGPVAWLIAGKKGRGTPRGLPTRGTGPSGGRRQVAPDDDPEFLRGLGHPSPPPPPAPDPPAPPDARDDGEEDDPPLSTR